MDKMLKLLTAAAVASVFFVSNADAGITIKCKKISTGGTICCASDGKEVTCQYLPAPMV